MNVFEKKLKKILKEEKEYLKKDTIGAYLLEKANKAIKYKKNKEKIFID